jgi:hypothetical protein
MPVIVEAATIQPTIWEEAPRLRAKSGMTGDRDSV